MKHLLVTNDFPPKVGGIQNYLWELWRRLPEDTAFVYTTPHDDSVAFDAAQPFPIERSQEPVLLPYPWLNKRIRRLAAETGSEIVVFDPAVPVGMAGPTLGLPYAVMLHGAEVTIPGRLPVLSAVLRRTLVSASLVIANSEYPLAEAERCAGRKLPSLVLPPGVDSERFHPANDETKRLVRERYGLSANDLLLASVSRLVPRKGMETLIRATVRANQKLSSAGLDTRLSTVIGGTGRQQETLGRLVAELNAPVFLAGRLADEEVTDLYGSADMMAMLCNERWFGLEQEGFGIVFLEAAAAGVPQVAGRSGGSHEAVADGETGIVVNDSTDINEASDALVALAVDPELRVRMGIAGRKRAVETFDYDSMALRLDEGLRAAVGSLKDRQ